MRTLWIPMSVKAVSARPEGTKRLPLAGLRIVLVDDCEDAREFTAYLLRSNGAVVIDVCTAAEAHAMVLRESPDVLVSDIAMPTADGYSLIRKVRQLPGTHGFTPAVALTAFDDAEDQRHALYAGFDSHVSKAPAGLQGLVEAVRQVALRRGSGVHRAVTPSASPSRGNEQ